jgi:hypothetical protein
MVKSCTYGQPACSQGQTGSAKIRFYEEDHLTTDVSWAGANIWILVCLHVGKLGKR